VGWNGVKVGRFSTSSGIFVRVGVPANMGSEQAKRIAPIAIINNLLFIIIYFRSAIVALSIIGTIIILLWEITQPI
jgi:hypothetical protein